MLQRWRLGYPVVSAVVAVACLIAAPGLPAADGGSPMTWQDARMLAEIRQRVQELYVAPVDDHALMQQAARGMLTGLDEYSEFLDPEEFQEVKLSTSGAYAGIGIEVETLQDAISIVRCIPGSPAERAGLRVADAIVSVDGVAITPGNVEAAVERMRGEPDTTVRLAVRRGAKQLQFDVQRTRVDLPSVESQPLAQDVGYLRITSFTDTTPQEFANALQRLNREARAPLRGLVIDLRDNPGGVLDAAVEVADDLLERGRIVSAVGRFADATFVAEAKAGDLSAGAELAVLINSGSASAAEILAAALRDNQRATLLGRKSYGKGSVQTILPISGGGALKLTTSRYYTPKGESLDHSGIVPDVSIDAAEQVVAELDADGATETLAARDVTVGIALQTLRQRIRVAAAPASPSRR